MHLHLRQAWKPRRHRGVFWVQTISRNCAHGGTVRANRARAKKQLCKQYRRTALSAAIRANCAREKNVLHAVFNSSSALAIAIMAKCQVCNCNAIARGAKTRKADAYAVGAPCAGPSRLVQPTAVLCHLTRRTSRLADEFSSARDWHIVANSTLYQRFLASELFISNLTVPAFSWDRAYCASRMSEISFG